MAKDETKWKINSYFEMKFYKRWGEETQILGYLTKAIRDKDGSSSFAQTLKNYMKALKTKTQKDLIFNDHFPFLLTFRNFTSNMDSFVRLPNDSPCKNYCEFSFNKMKLFILQKNRNYKKTLFFLNTITLKTVQSYFSKKRKFVVKQQYS